MIIIEMNDGSKYVNDPEIGLNLRDVDEIQECIHDCRKYYLAVGEHVVILNTSDIKSVYEQEAVPQ